jgi:large repetitive protein
VPELNQPGGTPDHARYVHVHRARGPFADQGAPGATGTYTISVGGAALLTVSFPATCCNAGRVGSAYLQNFFSSGGVAPFTWSVAAGTLPPGLGTITIRR